MIYEGNLFFNYQELKDVIIIVINNEKYPTRVIKEDNIFGLYCDNELIGVNIFNSNEYLKLKINGLVHNPNTPLVQVIHDIIKSSINEEVYIKDALSFLAVVKEKIENSNYIISLGDDEYISSSLEEVEVGDYVLVVKTDTRLDNGDMSTMYIKKNATYLIIAKEIQGIDNALGVQTYFIKEGK